MLTRKRLICGTLFVFVLALTALAQESPIDKPKESVAPNAAAPLVTAAATVERVRFVSPGSVVQLRLEVYNETGQKLFDSELHGGNVMDWHLQDGAGQRLAAGSYACVLTTKSLSGRLSQRVGLVTVSDMGTALEAVGSARLSAAQQQTIGPVEDNAAFAILKPSEAEAMTAVTHDGAAGQLTSTKGALTFRTGDVFAGKDKEHMRITEDGRVGIGTDKPEATLDVAGAVRVSEGIKFSDGTTLAAAGGKLSVRDGSGKLGPSAAGTGTINRIAKWAETGGAGTLTDAAGAEVSGVTIFGQNASGQVAPLFPTASNSHTLEVGAVGVKSPLTLAGGSGVMEFWKDLGGGTGSPAAAVAFGMATPGVASTNDMVFSTFTPAAAWNERMRLTTGGNLGIGIDLPLNKLDVAGNVNTSTHYRIGGNRVFSIPGVSNTFAGVNTGIVNTTGSQNSFFGNNAGAGTTTGASNSFFGFNAGVGNTAGGGNSFFGTDAGVLNTTGNFNTFVGNQAGKKNTVSENSFFGQNAGFNNTTGIQNSFFGQAAGFANTEAGYNSFFGYRAGAANAGSGGSANSFFGHMAGESSTSGGSNSFFGASAGHFNQTGMNNSFFGVSAGYFNSDGVNNSFFGEEAGLNNTASGNSFFGFSAGRGNTTAVNNAFFGGFSGQANIGSGNSFFGRSSGAQNWHGFDNAFFGSSAGQSNLDACCNAFFGANAGFANRNAGNNSFFGSGAGTDNFSGTDNAYFGANAGTNSLANNNSFFGSLAGDDNTMGANNAFFGRNAGGANSSGSSNTFLGESAASANSNGSSNIVIGSVAGLNLVSGSNNIYLANSGANESNTIRIGTEGTQTATFVAGINGINVNPSTSVVVNANGQLGVIASSQRYKMEIHNMGASSSKLMQLRPVTFLYRPEYVKGDQTLQYGLIAEEVAKVYPELVAFGTDGKPQTVRYHLLSTMLLNEVQKQERHIQLQARQLQIQTRELADLKARLRRLEARPSPRRRRQSRIVELNRSP